MPTTPLPAPAVLAKLVSNVTSTMLGISFAAAAPSPSSTANLKWTTARLPIPGERPVTVGLSSDSESCLALSAALFSCTRDKVSREMVEDALRELTNMTAGLVKDALFLDQDLGLPKISADASPPGEHSPPGGQSVMVKANQLGLFLWVCEGILEQH
jgi:CheY-specific phosphatase CheX